MPLERWQRLDPDQREAILAAAAEAFAMNGFHGASYNAILKAAGLSKGAAYYYFEDKEDLFLTLVEARSMAVFGDALAEEPLPERDFWGWASRSTLRMFHATVGDPQAWSLVKAFYTLHGRDGTPRTTVLWARMAAWFDALLERGQALGAVRTDLPRSLLTALVMGLGEAMDRWFLAELEPPGGVGLMAPDEALLLPMIEGSLDLFRRLLAP